jgi:chromate reductase, NAD(P)H dehydrogenase (quinone)
MTAPRVLVLAGSLRPGSFNAQLATAAADVIADQGGEVTRIDLADYPMPLYDATTEAEAFPTSTLALHAQFASHQGIFIATPEYNSFPSPLLLNTLDWLSRVRHYEGGMVEAFERPIFAISSASPSPIGGYRALMALRQKLSLGLGAFVVPAMAHVAAAYQAFGKDGSLLAEQDRDSLTKVMRQLLAKIAA